MAYEKFGLIEATDYNTLVNNPSTVGFNSVWSVGNANYGYGQPPLGTVTSPDKIESSNWLQLYNSTIGLLNHQTSANTKILTYQYLKPSVGNVITYQAQLGNVTTPGPLLLNLYNGTGNAKVQGTQQNLTVTQVSNWTDQITFNFTATFANGDAARYFFNAGGQIKFNFTQSSNTWGVNRVIRNLASDCGNIYLSQTVSTPRKIGNYLFDGVTQLDRPSRARTPTIIDKGYYNLETSNVQIFTQKSGNFFFNSGAYSNSSISLIANTNGPQGLNQDNGTVLTFYAVWNIEPNNIVTGGANTTMSIIYPSTTFISNTWGTVSTTGSVSGS